MENLSEKSNGVLGEQEQSFRTAMLQPCHEYASFYFMAKRLTDTLKWDKVWFRTLTPTDKCFWVYVCDRCDHAGIWEVDFETASYFIGQPLDPVHIKTVFNKQYQELNGGNRWLIKDFVAFQYGKLTENSKMYRPVLASLEKSGCELDTVSILYRYPIDTGKDKDKNKDKIKDIDTNTTSILYKDFEYNIIKQWNAFCLKYPKLSKIEAMTETRRQHLKTRFTQPTFKDFPKILEAVARQPGLIDGFGGDKHKNWHISFDWLICDDTNHVKVLENKYGDNNPTLSEEEIMKKFRGKK